ncbi:MAG: insulinase family protein [Thermodesulfobacteriota bacterium]
MKMTPGNTYSSFTLRQKRTIEEIDSEVFLFEHERLGCPLLAIKNSDHNKTFAVAFNTIPTDSSGVAHILEHSVLMGSKKYPVKDVFGEINKGGLMTFLNAMTGADITYYPFATRNIKEYFNIMDVYCDVVFNPLLEESTFEQEGYHYHQESDQSPLQLQGVVYNEMKGAFSDPIRLIFHHIFGGLMPGSTYSHESGGDPKNIPDLTFDEFSNFHKGHYHPSNSTFFLYGDAPLDEELAFLEDRFLVEFSAKGTRAEIDIGEEINEIRFIEDRYGVEAEELSEKTFLAVGSLVSTMLDRKQNIAFQIIANILFNSDGSPLKNAIISSGLCKDFGGFYLSGSSLKTFMVTYLVGSDPEKRDSFLELYQSTLTQMVKEGLDRDLLLGELNKQEFSIREEASKAQRGLDLIGKTMTALKYGAAPLEVVEVEELLQTIREQALNKGYFEELINQYLLDNPATVVVTLRPDPQKLVETREEELRRVEAYRATLDDDSRQQLIQRTTTLMESQLSPNPPETLALLPQLSLSDLEPEIETHATTPMEMFGTRVLVSEQPTERISYLDVGFDYSCIPSRLLPWLDLFGTIACEIGTSKLDFMAFAKEIATCSGGLSHSFNNYSRVNSSGKIKPVLWFHTRFLPKYQERALSLLGSIFQDLGLNDRARIREIVAREYAWAEHSAQSEGYNLATARAFAHLSEAGAYHEAVSGITAYRAEQQLARNYDQLEESFLEGLAEMASLLFNRTNLILSLTASGDEIDSFSKSGNGLLDCLATRTTPSEPPPLTNSQRHEAFITSAEVVYAIQTGKIFSNPTSYNGHFEVLKTYLSRDYLWNSVRQMGGAYGCFIQFSHITGNLGFVSYRDPQVRKTYDSYQGVARAIESLELPQKTLEQLIIGTYGNLNPHQSPAARGATARNDFLVGIDRDFKLRRIREVIATRLDDLRGFSEAFREMLANPNRTIIGNRSKIETDQDLFDELTEL